jgi:hypothetical protein
MAKCETQIRRRAKRWLPTAEEPVELIAGRDFLQESMSSVSRASVNPRGTTADGLDR